MASWNRGPVRAPIRGALRGVVVLGILVFLASSLFIGSVGAHDHTNTHKLNFNDELRSVPVSTRRRPSVHHSVGTDFTVTVSQRIARGLTVDDASVRAVLTALFYDTGGPKKWKNSSNWLNDNVCRWWGVCCHSFPPGTLSGSVRTCNASGNVVGIFLQGNGLTGTLPSNLTNISSLIALDLSNNEIGGPFPSIYANSSNLAYIDLSNNQITGEIPTSLGSVSKLNYLDISSNDMTGHLPSTMSCLINIQFAMMRHNRLEGGLPGSILPPITDGQGSQDEVVSNSMGLGFPVPAFSPCIPTFDKRMDPNQTAVPWPLRRTISGHHVLSPPFFRSHSEALGAVELMDFSAAPFSDVVLMNSMIHLDIAYNNFSMLVADLLWHSLKDSAQFVDVSANRFITGEFPPSLHALFASHTSSQYTGPNVYPDNDVTTYNSSTGPIRMNSLRMSHCSVSGNLSSSTMLSLFSDNLIELDLSGTFVEGVLPVDWITESYNMLRLNLSHTRMSDHNSSQYLDYSLTDMVPTHDSPAVLCPRRVFMHPSYIVDHPAPLELVVDPLYYGYSACVCDYGYAGTPPFCWNVMVALFVPCTIILLAIVVAVIFVSARRRSSTSCTLMMISDGNDDYDTDDNGTVDEDSPLLPVALSQSDHHSRSAARRSSVPGKRSPTRISDADLVYSEESFGSHITNLLEEVSGRSVQHYPVLSFPDGSSHISDVFQYSVFRVTTHPDFVPLEGECDEIIIVGSRHRATQGVILPLDPSQAVLERLSKAPSCVYLLPPTPGSSFSLDLNAGDLVSRSLDSALVFKSDGFETIRSVHAAFPAQFDESSVTRILYQVACALAHLHAAHLRCSRLDAHTILASPESLEVRLFAFEPDDITVSSLSPCSSKNSPLSRTALRPAPSHSSALHAARDVYFFAQFAQTLIYRLLDSSIPTSTTMSSSLRPRSSASGSPVNMIATIPPFVCSTFSNLIQACLSENPLDRPRACDIVQMLTSSQLESLMPPEVYSKNVRGQTPSSLCSKMMQFSSRNGWTTVFGSTEYKWVPHTLMIRFRFLGSWKSLLRIVSARARLELFEAEGTQEFFQDYTRPDQRVEIERFGFVSVANWRDTVVTAEAVLNLATAFTEVCSVYSWIPCVWNTSVVHFFFPDRVDVNLKNELCIPEFTTALSRLGSDAVGKIDICNVVSVPSSTDCLSFAKTLSALPSVSYAFPSTVKFLQS